MHPARQSRNQSRWPRENAKSAKREALLFEFFAFLCGKKVAQENSTRIGLLRLARRSAIGDAALKPA